MKIVAPFNPENAPSAAIRRALKKQDSRLLRSGCYAANEIKRATGWPYVDVTQEEIRVIRDKGMPLESMPTPKVVADMIPAHDNGRALHPFSVVLDTDKLQVVPKAPRGGKDRRERHDLTPDGKPRVRGKRGSYRYSRSGFTRPVESA